MISDPDSDIQDLQERVAKLEALAGVAERQADPVIAQPPVVDGPKPVSETLFACPSCKGWHFNITTAGTLVCTSMTFGNTGDKCGCGWKGHLDPVPSPAEFELCKEIDALKDQLEKTQLQWIKFTDLAPTEDDAADNGWIAWLRGGKIFFGSWNILPDKDETCLWHPILKAASTTPTAPPQEPDPAFEEWWLNRKSFDPRGGFKAACWNAWKAAWSAPKPEPVTVSAEDWVSRADYEWLNQKCAQQAILRSEGERRIARFRLTLQEVLAADTEAHNSADA